MKFKRYPQDLDKPTFNKLFHERIVGLGFMPAKIEDDNDVYHKNNVTLKYNKESRMFKMMGPDKFNVSCITLLSKEYIDVLIGDIKKHFSGEQYYENFWTIKKFKRRQNG